MVVSGQLHAPAALSPGKNVGIHSIAGWMGPRADLDSFGEEKMFLPMPGYEPRTVQPIGNRYTDTEKKPVFLIYSLSLLNYSLDRDLTWSSSRISKPRK
jgi:hypothetical protein